MSKLKAHPYADLFPMMTAVELESLAADIAENGLRQPVVRYQGAVLDGRNRLLACEKAGVEPTFTDYEGDDAGALALVISLNVQRRDLTAAQRAIVAARALEQMPERRGRPGKDGKTSHVLSRDLAASTFKVSDKSVQQAKAVLAEAPDLAAQVESCAISLASAYEQTQGRKKESERKTKSAERIAEYRDAISAGDMTVEEALRRVDEEAGAEKERIEHDASARKIWLRGLDESLRWFEEWAATRTDEDLGWYTQEGAPGAGHEGIDRKRLSAAADQLKRIGKFTIKR
jgi:ParB-like chromosome segregation protein Spo0J